MYPIPAATEPPCSCSVASGVVSRGSISAVAGGVAGSTRFGARLVVCATARMAPSWSVAQVTKTGGILMGYLENGVICGATVWIAVGGTSRLSALGGTVEDRRRQVPGLIPKVLRKTRVKCA